MKRSIFVLALFSLLLATGIAYAEDYVIGKGDMLAIRVWGEDSLSAESLVRTDGKITVPGVGDIQADGITTQQLRRNITAKLSALVNEPLVTVMVRSSPNSVVTIHGSGAKSGLLPLNNKMTLLQALSQIGPTEVADLDKAYLMRDGKVLVQGLRDLFEKGNMEKDVELKSGDRIFIPLKENYFVYVDGAVNKPTTLAYREGMTVLEAIHQAGGFSKFADRNDTIIVRSDPAGAQNIAVRAGDLIDEADLSQNLPLHAGDVLLVRKGWF